LAKGKDAIVSRGELVEIGGGFRIPDVIIQGGARLKEVGTTNKTRVADYEAALSDDTGVLLKVHRSNFALVGFTQEATVKELSALARPRGIPVVLDLGTGRMLDAGVPTPDEPTVMDAVNEGADLLMFSGDKLLGGPQAGILLGRADLIAKCRQHPLCRALRVDKMTLAALMATLRLHLDGRGLEIPALAMMLESVTSLKERAHAICSALRTHNVECSVVDVFSTPGGGTLPTTQIASAAVALASSRGAEELATALRTGEVAVVCRVEEGRVLLDLRCVLPSQDLSLVAGVVEALGGPRAGRDSGEIPC
jgi:L-seryl-tRNA(Ser) seleniumtransferase